MRKTGKPYGSRERERERVTLNNVIFGRRLSLNIAKVTGYIVNTTIKRIDYIVNIVRKNVYDDIACPFCV